jgi:hypothetical protein
VGGFAISAVLSGALAWVQNGPYHVQTLVAFWITGIIPLALFASQMAVLLPAGQPSRRRAILLGIVASIATMVVCFVLPVGRHLYAALRPAGLSLERLADPSIRAALPGFPKPLSPDTLLRIGTAFGIMAVVWTITVRRGSRE